jgi:hypothetical protein
VNDNAKHRAILKRLSEGDFLHTHDVVRGYFWHGYGQTYATPYPDVVDRLVADGLAVQVESPSGCCRYHVVARKDA